MILFSGILMLFTACAETGRDTGEPVVREVWKERDAFPGSVAFPAACSSEADLLVRRGVALLHNLYPG